MVRARELCLSEPKFSELLGDLQNLLAVQPAPGAGGAGGGGPLDFLRTNPQFIALRQIVQSNPMILQPMLQARGTCALPKASCDLS